MAVVSYVIMPPKAAPMCDRLHRWVVLRGSLTAIVSVLFLEGRKAPCASLEELRGFVHSIMLQNVWCVCSSFEIYPYPARATLLSPSIIHF